jgi:hypothetical protein
MRRRARRRKNNMWIRTQDHKSLVNVNEIRYRNGYIYGSYSRVESSPSWLGYYAEDEALRILNDIQGQINYRADNRAPLRVFVMPLAKNKGDGKDV